MPEGMGRPSGVPEDWTHVEGHGWVPPSMEEEAGREVGRQEGTQRKQEFSETHRPSPEELVRFPTPPEGVIPEWTEEQLAEANRARESEGLPPLTSEDVASLPVPPEVAEAQRVRETGAVERARTLESRIVGVSPTAYGEAAESQEQLQTQQEAAEAEYLVQLEMARIHGRESEGQYQAELREFQSTNVLLGDKTWIPKEGSWAGGSYLSGFSDLTPGEQEAAKRGGIVGLEGHRRDKRQLEEIEQRERERERAEAQRAVSDSGGLVGALAGDISIESVLAAGYTPEQVRTGSDFIRTNVQLGGGNWIPRVGSEGKPGFEDYAPRLQGMLLEQGLPAIDIYNREIAMVGARLGEVTRREFRQEFEEWKRDKIQLGDDQWIYWEDFKELPPKAQKLVREKGVVGIEEYNREAHLTSLAQRGLYGQEKGTEGWWQYAPGPEERIGYKSGEFPTEAYFGGGLLVPSRSPGPGESMTTPATEGDSPWVHYPMTEEAAAASREAHKELGLGMIPIYGTYRGIKKGVPVWQSVLSGAGDALIVVPLLKGGLTALKVGGTALAKAPVLSRIPRVGVTSWKDWSTSGSFVYKTGLKKPFYLRPSAHSAAQTERARQAASQVLARAMGGEGVSSSYIPGRGYVTAYTEGAAFGAPELPIMAEFSGPQVLVPSTYRGLIRGTAELPRVVDVGYPGKVVTPGMMKLSRVPYGEMGKDWSLAFGKDMPTKYAVRQPPLWTKGGSTGTRTRVGPLTEISGPPGTSISRRVATGPLVDVVAGGAPIQGWAWKPVVWPGVLKVTEGLAGSTAAPLPVPVTGPTPSMGLELPVTPMSVVPVTLETVTAPTMVPSPVVAPATVTVPTLVPITGTEASPATVPEAGLVTSLQPGLVTGVSTGTVTATTPVVTPVLSVVPAVQSSVQPVVAPEVAAAVVPEPVVAPPIVSPIPVPVPVPIKPETPTPRPTFFPRAHWPNWEPLEEDTAVLSFKRKKRKRGIRQWEFPELEIVIQDPLAGRKAKTTIQRKRARQYGARELPRVTGMRI